MFWNVRSIVYICAVDKREQIIQAAMQLFVEQDVQATPMSAIAKAAKTGMGTIYNYFVTKEELINAIFISIKTDQYRHVAKEFDGVAVKKQFEHYYVGFSQYWLEHPVHFFFVDQFERSPVLTLTTKQQGLTILQPVVDILLAGQQQGIIKPVDPEELIVFLNGGLLAFIRWVLITGRENTSTLLQNQLKMAWDAIKE